MIKQRGQQSGLAPPPTLVAPKFGAPAGAARRPSNAVKGPRIEAPPPLNIPPSIVDISNASAAAAGAAMSIGGGAASFYTKPRSGSFSIAAHSPRQKLAPQPMTHAPTATEIPITLTTESGNNEEITSPITDIKNGDDSKIGEAALTSNVTMEIGSGEGGNVTRTMRSNSVAVPVKPRLEPVAEQVNVSIPINPPVIKKFDNYPGNKGPLTIRIASELLPNKEFSFQSESNIAGDILNNAIKLLQMKDLKEKEEKYVLIFKSADGSVLTLNHKRSIFSYGIEPYDPKFFVRKINYRKDLKTKSKAKTGGLLRRITGKTTTGNSGDRDGIHLQQCHVAAMSYIETWTKETKAGFPETINNFTYGQQGLTKAQLKELAELRNALEKTDGVGLKGSFPPQHFGAVVMSFFNELPMPIIGTEFIDELEKVISGRDQSKFIIQLEKLDSGIRGILKRLAIFVRNVDANIFSGSSGFRETFFRLIYQHITPVVSLSPTEKEDEIARGSILLARAVDFLPTFMLFTGRVQGKIAPMPGEIVLRGYDNVICVNRDLTHIEDSFIGELWLTNYRVIFRYPPRTGTNSDAELVEIPLRSIASIERDTQERIKIVTGTFAVHYVALYNALPDTPGRVYRDICAALEDAQVTPYAFSNTELPIVDPDAGGSLAAREMARLGLPEEAFRVSDANKDFSITLSYPQQLIVPRAIEDGVIHRQGLEFAKRRFPYLAWHNAAAGTGFYRSFPLTEHNEGNRLYIILLGCNGGMLQVFDTAGEEWVRQHRQGSATALSLPTPAQVREAFFDLVDTEFTLDSDSSAISLAAEAALEEAKRGDIAEALAIIAGRRINNGNIGGDDSTTTGSSSGLQTSPDGSSGGAKDGIDASGSGDGTGNMGESGAGTGTASASDISGSDAIGSGADVSGIGEGGIVAAEQLPKPKWRDFPPFNVEWNRQITRLVDAAATVAGALGRSSVLLEHGSSDWCGADCTVSSLVQIALDPYYRTLEGFMVLVSKEWVLSGFPFSLRSFLGDPSEPLGYAPIFLQFLSAVYRVFITFPSQFEFTEELLLFIADSVYSGRFGTFISNTAAEAEYLSKNTVSVWTYIREHRAEYINAFYYPEETSSLTLDLQHCSRNATWNLLYMRGHPMGVLIKRRLQKSMTFLINKKASLTELSQRNVGFFYVPKQLCHIERLVKLDLTGNHLVSLSPEIGNLVKLKELILAENEFTSIPGSIFTILSKLPDLEIINFSKNSLTTLPEEIADMETLTTLNISKNAFSMFPPALMRVKGLVTLNISYNRIEFITQNDAVSMGSTTPPNSTSPANSLLGGPGESITPTPIGGGLALALAAGCPSFFDTLVELQLDHNRLVAFPESFTYLRKLQRLNLSHNNLERFPTHFYRLRALRALDASYNRLALLPSSLTTLYRLEELNLEHNNLTRLPTSIGQLVQLRVLLANNNKLTTIPSRLGQLSELETLNISRNSITALKDTMGMLTHIKEFVCDGPPRIAYPSAELLTANYAVMAEAFREGMAARITTHRVKLIIVGSENVGKTSLLRSLRRKRTMVVGVGGGASKAEIQYNLSTDGVKIEDWPFSMEFDEYDESTGKVARVRKHDITVSAWDFAGQQIYGTTHQFFLSSKAVYLAVWDMQQPIDESSMYNWLWTIRMYAPTAPIIIVGTHRDKIQGGSSGAKRIITEAVEKYAATFAQSRVSVTDIMGCGPQDPCDGSMPLDTMGNSNFELPLTGYAVSCINDEGVSKLRHGLEATLRRYPYTRQNVTKAFLVLEKLILEEREGNLQPVLTWTEFCTLAAVCSLSTQELARRAAEYLNQLGTIVYFPQDPELSDIVVIDPQWLSDLFTTLVTTKSNYASNGIMSTRNLLHLWRPPKFPQEMHRKLLTLLERFEIVFNISLRRSEDLHTDPVDILVPSVLPEQEPTAEITACWPQLRVRGPIRQAARVISFGQVIPPGFFLRLLVRVLKAMQTVPTHIWLHGLILKVHPRRADPGKEGAELVDTVLYVRERDSGGVVDIMVRGSEAALQEVCAFARTAFDAATSFFSDEIKEKVAVYVPCTHCVLTKAQTLKMFVINECENAIIRGDKEFKCNNGTPVSLDLLVPELDLGALATPKADMSEIDIESVLGQGATAIVHKGYYKDSEVAVKKLRMDADDRKSRCGSQSFTEFRREAYVMSTCKHPCIVGLAAVCLRPLCLLTEFIPYGTLFDLVNDLSRPLDFAMAVKIAHDVASGMAFLHSLSPPQLHRDLKSPNVFINGKSSLDLVVGKVADFGLTGNAYTIVWLAPEVMQRQEPTMASDVYSFGVILWELVARKQFFSEISFMTVLESKVIAGERPEIPADCPLAYRKLIQACWAPNPTKRPPFAEVVCILEEIIHDPELKLEGKITLCTDKTKKQTPRSFIKSVSHPLSLEFKNMINSISPPATEAPSIVMPSPSVTSVTVKRPEANVVDGGAQKAPTRSYSPSSESGASMNSSAQGSLVGDDEAEVEDRDRDLTAEDTDSTSASTATATTNAEENTVSVTVESDRSSTPMIDISEIEEDIGAKSAENPVADKPVEDDLDLIEEANRQKMLAYDQNDHSLDEYEVPPQFDDMDDTFYEGIDSFHTPSSQKPPARPEVRALPKQLLYQIQHQAPRMQPAAIVIGGQPPSMAAPLPPSPMQVHQGFPPPPTQIHQTLPPPPAQVHQALPPPPTQIKRPQADVTPSLPQSLSQRSSSSRSGSPVPNMPAPRPPVYDSAATAAPKLQSTIAISISPPPLSPRQQHSEQQQQPSAPVPSEPEQPVAAAHPPDMPAPRPPEEQVPAVAQSPTPQEQPAEVQPPSVQEQPAVAQPPSVQEQPIEVQHISEPEPQQPAPTQPPSMPAPPPPPPQEPKQEVQQPVVSQPPSVLAPQQPSQEQQQQQPTTVSLPPNVVAPQPPEQQQEQPVVSQVHSASALSTSDKSPNLRAPLSSSAHVPSARPHGINMKYQQFRKMPHDFISTKSASEDDDDYYYHKTDKPTTTTITTAATTTTPAVSSPGTIPTSPQFKTLHSVPTGKTSGMPMVPGTTMKAAPGTAMYPVKKVSSGLPPPHFQPPQKAPQPPSGVSPVQPQPKIVPSTRLLSKGMPAPAAKRPMGAAPPPPPTGSQPGVLFKRPMGAAPPPPGTNSMMGSASTTAIKVAPRLKMAHVKQVPKVAPSGPMNAPPPPPPPSAGAPVPVQKVGMAPLQRTASGYISPPSGPAPTQKMGISLSPPGCSPPMSRLRPTTSMPIAPGQKRVVPSFPAPHAQGSQFQPGAPPPPPQGIHVKVNCAGSSEVSFPVSCTVSISDEVVWMGRTDGQISIMDVKTNGIIKSFDAHSGNGGVLCMIKAGKKEVMTAGRGIVKKWSFNGDLLSTTPTESVGDVTNFVFAGVSLCGGTNKGMICVWNMSTADFYTVDIGFKDREIAALAIFGKSLIAAVGSELVFLSPAAHDGGRLAVNKVVKTPHEGGVHAIVAFSPVCFVTIDASFTTAIRWNSPEVKAVVYSASADEVAKGGSSGRSSAMGVNRVLVVYARNKFYFLEALNGRVVGTFPNYSGGVGEFETSLVMLNHFPNSPNARFMLAPRHGIHISVWDMNIC